MNNQEVISALKAKLVISCQALPGEPLYTEAGGIMPLMAYAAELAGASGIRCNSVRDINEIRAMVKLPTIGIIKQDYLDSPIYITPTFEEVSALVQTGTEIIALDYTDRIHPNNVKREELFHQIKQAYPNQLLMADISNFEEAKAAVEIGFDFVGTTLNGYVGDERTEGPNFDLVSRIVNELDCRCIAEGRIHEPSQARKMLELGAFAVVVGGAITRPLEIATRFIKEINKDR